MLTDCRYAIRARRGAPAFVIVAVSTLALGIAIHTIAFTLLNSLALRPMRQGSVLIATASAFLAAVASVACYLPARRAARVDPIVAFRSE